jgi:hypothetical protein
VKKLVVSTFTVALVLIGATPAAAGPKEIIEWLKDPCVPNGDLENDCQLPL